MSKKVEKMIITAYCEKYNLTNNYNESNQSSSLVRYYFGKRHNVYFAVVYSDAYLHINYLEYQGWESFYIMYYPVIIDGYVYPFINLPEQISAYYNNRYYTLQEASDEKIISLDDIDWLYNYCNEHIFKFQLYYKTFEYVYNPNNGDGERSLDGLTIK